MLNGGSWGSKVQHQATENPVLRSIQRRCSKVETETSREGGDEAQDTTELAEDAGENQGEAEGAKPRIVLCQDAFSKGRGGEGGARKGVEG